MTCPTCGAANLAADGLCPACLLNKALDAETLQCAKCQNFLDDEARFCSQCGTAAPMSATFEGDPIRTALESKLQSQYRIIRLLGRGGMGAVYLARDLTLDREVAVKVIKTGTEGREIYDRFRREARTAAKLSHPNIVPLHAFGEVEGMPYFVMGYVRGESLASRLRRDGKLSDDEGRRVVAEIADALDHAHRQGVVHRDIKPDNVLIDDESGRAMLTDFGVAKALGSADTMTVAGSVVGTPHYMSPEQASGRTDIDGRSDIYSLGVMAYTMFSGRLPFDGNTVSEILSKHLTQEPAPLRSLAPNVSDGTAQVVERCLAKDRAQRWPDARSLKVAVGGSETAQLPDGLHEIEGQGVIALVIVTLAFVPLFLTRPPFGVYVLNAVVYTTIYLIVLGRLRYDGFSFSQSQRALWTEPKWWAFWYPRRLRRPANVWDRLPRPVRHMRALPTILLPLLVLLFIGPFPNAYRSPVAFWTKVGMFGALVVTWDLFMLRGKLHLKRLGVVGVQSRRMLMSAPLSNEFWSRPNIVALLAPASKEARRETTHDQLQSILRNANELSGALRPLGSEAAVAARQLIASIDDVDREIAELAQSLEPGEEERLADKIASLTRDDDQPLRTLLDKQRELIRGLVARVEEAKERRNRRVEMLKTLALHVASLRARSSSSEAATDVRMISDRVRGLCDEIARQPPETNQVATIAR